MRLSFLIIFLIGLVSCKSYVTDDSPSTEIPKDITLFQQYMLDEINFARTKPAEYAESRLKAFNDHSTDNGSYQYLKNLTPVTALSFSNALNQSATKYAVFLANNNLIGHDADGTALSRAIREGYTGSLLGENIAGASDNLFNATLNPQSTAIGFVSLLIIDDGVADFGHRLIMLNSKYKIVGIGFGRNAASTYINYTVQDFGN
ncbi:MAG: CAP domain-containing protein [Bacteroidia bacterium]|nr:CAP domain-containing protein [Bacteroidia bacterium]